jgi:hypothetical protein
VGGAIIISAWITHKDKGALSVLNLASNNIGELVLPRGWSEGWKADLSAKEYTHTDGSKQDQHPGKPEGIIALANAIPDMGAMTSLNLASNNLRAGGAKVVAEAIKVTKCTPVIILVPFSCPSGFSISCCCLLLSAGYEGDDEPESCVE